MIEFKKREERVQAEKIETSADVYRIAEQLEANYVDEKTYFNANGRETQYTISGPRFDARNGRDFNLTLVIGMWFVKDGDRVFILSDRELRKTYVDLNGKEIV